jgi:signal transduction histidine kinase
MERSMDLVHGVEKEMIDGARPATDSLYQKMKEPLNEIHSTFVQNVSHELRTPLTILYGYAEMLSNGDMGQLTAKQQCAASVITDRARLLGKLIERIEILLAIEANLTTLLPLAFAELVAKAMDGKHLHAARAGITLEVHLDLNVPFVWGDPQQLRQAIECLIENALKFTPSGGQVGVHVYAESDQVCLAVTDSGIGMTPQELEHILDGFYQADGSTTRRHGGLGLGLTVVKAVVAEHGGKIQIESQVGQGSRFVISLPAMQADGPAGSNLPQAARWLPWSACTEGAAK